MTSYVIRRIIYMLVVFIILSFLMYALYNLIPNDPARAEMEQRKKAEKLTPEQYESEYLRLRKMYGLDDSLFVRYLRWFGLYPAINLTGDASQDGKLSGLIQGNFGQSNYYKTKVADVIGEPMGNTLFINIFATVLALGITIPLGIYCAVKKNSKFDQSVQVITIVGYSIPIYIVALIFIFLFSVLIRVFPIGGMKAAGSTAVGFEAFIEKLYYIALPLIVMTFASLGGMTRYVRAAMIDSLGMDYIRTARAKGVKEKVVIYSHAFRNALLPIITVIIGWFLTLFSGSVIIEQTFSLNGMGKLYIEGLNHNDFELVLAMQMFYTIVALVGNLITDLSYGIVDPRVRIQK
ncbi:MAG: ABC transporter permease [Clostridia bacterium]